MPESLGIRWAPLAADDLERSFEHVRESSPRAARDLVVQLREAVSLLPAHPRMGPVAEELQPRGAYRSILVGSHHRVFYRLGDDYVWVLRILDTRRNPEDLDLDR